MAAKKATSAKKKTPPKLKPKLSLKEQLFCYAYIKHAGNASQAAREAGYSLKTAPFIGAENLKKPKIATEIKRLKDELLGESAKEASDIIKELDNIAFSDITNVVGWNESGLTFLKSSEEIDKNISRTIESIEVTEDYVKGERDKDGHVVLKSKLKMHSKLQALKLRAQIEGLLKEGPTIEFPKEITINYKYVRPEDGN